MRKEQSLLNWYIYSKWFSFIILW